MIKWRISLLLLAMLILTGCSSSQTPKISSENLSAFSTDAINAIKKVANIYGEQNPQIKRIKEDVEESSKKPMYIVFLEGNFQSGEQKSQKLEFSMTSDCKKIWALRFDNWVENEINISN